MGKAQTMAYDGIFKALTLSVSSCPHSQPIHSIILSILYTRHHVWKVRAKDPRELGSPQGGPYNVFAGKDASRALGKTSTKPEDARADWQDLDDKEKGVLNDWVTFFSKRYNVVGVVEGATNMD